MPEQENKESFPIYAAIGTVSSLKVLELIQQSTSEALNAANDKSQTALHRVIAVETVKPSHFGRGGRTKLLSALIAKGANVNAKDEDGETTLHYLARWIIKSGQAGNKIKAPVVIYTAIPYSRIENNRRILLPLESLLQAPNLDIDSRNKDGKTACYLLIEALHNSQKSGAFSKKIIICLVLLFEAKASAVENQVPVLFARLKEIICELSIDLIMMDALRRIISLKIIPINYKDEQDCTLLTLCYQAKQLEWAEILLKEGANPIGIMPSSRNTFIGEAILNGDYHLLPTSTNFDEQSITTRDSTFSHLTWALFLNHYAAVEKLINKLR